MTTQDYLIAGAAVGAFGDITLQWFNSKGGGNEGLEQYFADNSGLPAIASAAALTGAWSGLYAALAGGHVDLSSFTVWATAVDLLYRAVHPIIFPSLGGYYEKNNISATVLYNVGVATAVWTAVQMAK